MTDRSHHLDGEPDIAAAELALGVLDGEERAAALRRVLAEPGFASEVERWRGYFGALFVGVPKWSPRGRTASAVMARLDRPVATRRDLLEAVRDRLVVGGGEPVRGAVGSRPSQRCRRWSSPPRQVPRRWSRR